MCIQIMHSITLLHNADSSLGRLDYTLMSDQALMEMFIEDFGKETKKIHQDANGMYLDVCEWMNVSCDKDKKVSEIRRDFYPYGCSLHLSFIPPKVTFLLLPQRGLRGTIDLAHLPESMANVELRDNRLEGSLDLTHLPARLKWIKLSENRFTGTISLTELPSKLIALFLNANELEGSIDLAHLPQSIQILTLSENKFSGSIDVTNLPRGMLHFILDDNQFSGSFIATNLPPNIQEFSANDNKFSGIAVIDSKTRVAVELFESGVKSAVDEKGNAKVSGVHFERFPY